MPLVVPETVTIPAWSACAQTIVLEPDFDLSRAGQYSIEVEIVVDDDAAQRSRAHARFSRENKTDPRPIPSEREQRNQEDGGLWDCSPSQTEVVRDGHRTARLSVSAAIDALISGGNEDFISTWFGGAGDAEVGRALKIYLRLRNALRDRRFVVDCAGDYKATTWTAYVYKGRPLQVFLRPRFWDGFGGKRSPGSVFVHETSHFPETADSEDVTTDYINARRLSSRKRDKVFLNAEGIEYFAACALYRQLGVEDGARECVAPPPPGR